MKALELAKIQLEVEQSNLPADTRAVLLDWIRRDRSWLLERGRQHLEICHAIQSCLDQGFLLEYAIKTQAALSQLDEKTIRRIWRHWEQVSTEKPFPTHLKTAS